MLSSTRGRPRADRLYASPQDFACMGWFDGLPPRQRRLYLILIGIIALTLPCYCLGISALALAPSGRAPAAVTGTPTLQPTSGPATATLPANATLEPTPTNWVPPTITDTPPPGPTATATHTHTPTHTPTPTTTAIPTATPTHVTNTPEATSTFTPSPLPPTPTATPTRPRRVPRGAIPRRLFRRPTPPHPPIRPPTRPRRHLRPVQADKLMDVAALLKQFSQTPGLSRHETEIRSLLRAEWGRWAADTCVDKM